MNELIFTTGNGELLPDDKQAMVDGMLAYHASKGHPRKADHYSITIKSENVLIGVVIVTFLWNGMEIDTLWVNEAYRGQGLGTKLMNMVEEEGKRRKCSIAYTNTFSWQAPEFYKKLGYSLFGKLDNFPENCSLSYLMKLLR